MKEKVPIELLPHVIQLTPPGRGAIATLRVEGPGAVAAVESRFRAHGGRPLAALPADRLTVGCFGGDVGEEIVVRRCADDAVELHCHGGAAAVAMIEETLLEAGCRRLAWRDWVAARHADPIAAAAITALADAHTQRTAAILLDQYHGALGRAMAEIHQAMDRGDREAAQRKVDALLKRADLGRHLVRPWRVVLAGRDNVGKSSLINCLAGYGRSIVHSAPGTTRDLITLTTAIDGWPVELCDTAGLRTGTGPFFGVKAHLAEKPRAENMDLSSSSADLAIERAGIQRARERIAQADLAVLVFDRSQVWSQEDQTLMHQWPGALLVHNKSDLPAALGERPAGILTSALRAEGIDSLLDAIACRLVPEPPPSGAAVPFSDEQIEMVRSAVREAGTTPCGRGGN